MRIAVLCLAALCLVGCGGDDDGNGDDAPGLSPDGGTGKRECTDEDGDGFGRYCSRGTDCDDDDPKMTDECVRCADPDEPAKGCPCEPGTKYLTCDPEDKRIVKDGMAGTLVCSDGARYCRQGAWSDCEILLEYANFVPD
jgi:hypothetical protein